MSKKEADGWDDEPKTDNGKRFLSRQPDEWGDEPARKKSTSGKVEGRN